jgi:hypothetical protein
LLKIYWPQHTGKIILNTDKKEFNISETNIVCSKTQGRSIARLTWSESFSRALDLVETKYLVYFQEDYFLCSPVDHYRFLASLNEMATNPEIKSISLTAFGSLGPYKKWRTPGFCEINRFAKYRLSTQVSLWDVESLKSYIRNPENAWQFELLGTVRSWLKNETFLACWDERSTATASVFKYPHTGVIKGSWNSEVVGLFSSHGITVDFSRRGFHSPQSKFLSRYQLLKKIFNK